jgi:glycolate dehydrogenase FAD-binding subunit
VTAGHSPALLTPTADVEVAAALRHAAEARQTVLIRGAGTKLGWGRPPGPIDAVLDMRGLNQVLAHDHGDMTATIQAGATLAEANRALARYGQWLPLDPPHAGAATIGGILATNDSGPLRHRCGTPRDLLIGVQLATTAGVLARAGGRVVKNVAGYDLGKLATGSFGSLAAIVTATFKLSPLPAAAKTLRLDVADAEALATIVRTVMASQLEPIAFEVESRAPTRSRDAADAARSGRAADAAGAACCVLLRFASLPAVVDAQVERALAALEPCAATARVVEGADQEAIWREHADHIWRDGDDAIVRASWLPANIGAVIAALPSGAAAGAATSRARSDEAVGSERSAAACEIVGRAAVGAGWVRIAGDVDAQAHAIERMRGSQLIGNVVVVRGTPALKARVDVWGSPGDRQPIFDAIKRAFDPDNVLNAGRGPL